MKVVSLSSRKGGAGKSTICVHLAVAAEARGLRTAIFDLDPQASAALWSDHRGEPIPAVVPAQAPRLKSLLKQAVDGGADLVLLDTPPHADGVSADAGAVSDAILIPCRPSAFDLDAIGATVRVALASRKPCWVVINAAPIQGSEVAETRAALEAASVQVSPVVIHQRKAFSARAHRGRTAGEIEPDSKAAAEITDLLEWLGNIIGLPKSPDSKIAKQAFGKVDTKPTTRVASKRGSKAA
jgi:chromosome partitioning protein